MAITYPQVFTSTEDAETVKNRPVSEEVVRKFIQNSNLLGSLCPIGSIRAVLISAVGVHPPNVDLWQIADGAQITHGASPLTSVGIFLRYTPDFTNTYMRGAMAEAVNNSGGSHTTDLSHTHDTDVVCGNKVGEEGDERKGYPEECHSHTTQPDLSSEYPLEVSHQELAIYLKIN